MKSKEYYEIFKNKEDVINIFHEALLKEMMVLADKRQGKDEKFIVGSYKAAFKDQNNKAKSFYRLMEKNHNIITDRNAFKIYVENNVGMMANWITKL